MASAGEKAAAEAGLRSLSDRLHASLALDANKPDTKDFPDLGSPVSPLRTAGGAGAGAAQTSSSSSSSGSLPGRTPANAVRKSDASAPSGRQSHSGELSGSSATSPAAPDTRTLRSAHRRSGSGPLIYSGGSGSSSGGGGVGGGGGGSSTASSPVNNVLPAGNIFPSGRIGKPGMMARTPARSDVLGSGAGNYGHGSVMRGGAGGMAAGSSRSTDPEEVTRAGNEQYKRGQFAEALRLYDRAVAMCPDNAACRSNRAAALTGLGRLEEAVSECEKAIRFDPSCGRAHHRLASLYLRLGQVEDARRHLFLMGQHPDSALLQKLQAVERHLRGCAEARKIEDWKSSLRETDAAIAAGADSSLLLNASRAEALLRLHQLDEADSNISKASTYATSSLSSLQTKFFGMLSNSYFHIVQAQVEMALGRFENAVAAAEKARQIDSRNVEVITVLSKVKSVAKARTRGNDLFNAGKFAEASIAYGEGLKYDPSNPVLHCNRAACRAKLGQWERSLEDCNEALRIKPMYTKALLRRAASYAKLERWVAAVRDYEILRKELPDDKEVAEALFHAQVALKTSRGEEVSNLKFGGEVEEITGVEQYQAEVSLPGVSVVYFMTATSAQCKNISPFVDGLCSRFPSVNFLKVDNNNSPSVARAENVRIVPTFKIYKNGLRLKEMICPSHQVLESSVRHYSL